MGIKDIITDTVDEWIDKLKKRYGVTELSELGVHVLQEEIDEVTCNIKNSLTWGDNFGYTCNTEYRKYLNEALASIMSSRHDGKEYRKKPVVIKAFRLGYDYIPDWFMDEVTKNHIILRGTSEAFEHHNDTNADIITLEGVMHANYGDYVICGVNGEIYPCKPDIFDKTYEEVNPTEC